MEKFSSSLCISCQEFYGSPERKGYCSVCYSDLKLKDRTISIDSVNTGVSSSVEIPVLKEENVNVSVTEIDASKVQTNTFNCWKCDRRVGYMGFKCNCGYVFCSGHRHFKDHDCAFDFKSHDRAKMKQFSGFKNKQNI